MSIIKRNDINLSPQIYANINAIDVYNTSWQFTRQQLAPDLLDSLKSLGVFESIGSSNRIEGNTLSNEEIERLLGGLSTNSFKSRDEAEVAGYSEVLKLILDNFSSIQLSENHIKQIHQMMLRYTEKDERHRGEYKMLDNAVASFDQNGNEIGIIFRTASPFETPIMMNELVEETNEMLADPLFHPLVTIGLFIVHFLSIHPFQDGNGRLSRLLTLLLLLKKGYGFVEFYSLEKIIEEEKSYYYSALRQTQMSFSRERYEYGPWLNYFTALLKKASERLEEKVAAYRNDSNLTGLEKRVFLSVKKLDGARIGLIAEDCQMPVAQVRNMIRTLLRKGLVVQHGEKKGTWYSVRKV